MAQFEMTITEQDLKRLVQEYLEKKLNIDLDEKDIQIQTKSQQNYRSEWESGAGFRAKISKEVS